MAIPSKWATTIVLILGVFMSFLDQTIVNIAIPNIQHSLQADIQSVQWIVTAYLLTQAALTPTTPFLTALLGRKSLYLLSLSAFTLGSLLCALAWNLPALIFFRILQGAGGAFLFPLSMTILLQAFPVEERGMAMASIGIPGLAAPMLGPIVGGFLVTFISWQVIFLINIPIGILAVILGAFLLPKTSRAETGRFDLPGFLTSAYGLSAMLYAFSAVSRLGWGSPRVLVFLSSGGLMLVLFVIRELLLLRRGKKPLLNMLLFTDRSFAAGIFTLICIAISLFGASFLLPIYLQTLRGQSALQASFILLPLPLATLVGMLLSGKLVDRLRDARLIVIPGLLLLAVSIWLLMGITLSTPYWQLGLNLALLGFALGMVGQPLNVALMINIHSAEAVTNGTTLLTVMRTIGASLGTAILATLVQTQANAHYAQLVEQSAAHRPETTLHMQALLAGFHDVFFITILLILPAFLVAFLFQKKPAVTAESGVPAALTPTR